MSFLRWVVDACVLYEVPKGNWQAVEFLLAIRKWHGLALDHHRVIQGQYDRVVWDHELLTKWFTHLKDVAGKIHWFASDIPSVHRKQLLESLNFHDDDLVYVGVACNTPDRLIVTEDREPGDFDDAVCEYLHENLKISVLCIADSCEKATSSAAG